jgi:hypothetical protein
MEEWGNGTADKKRSSRAAAAVVIAARGMEVIPQL